MISLNLVSEIKVNVLAHGNPTFFTIYIYFILNIFFRKFNGDVNQAIAALFAKSLSESFGNRK